MSGNVAVTDAYSAEAVKDLKELLGRIASALAAFDAVADGALPVNAQDEESQNLRKAYEAVRELLVKAVAVAEDVANGKQEQINSAVATLQKADEAAQQVFGTPS